jgi:hypothetical protein
MTAPAKPTAPPGDIARARSALEAAQSELHSIQIRLAPLRQQERRAVEKLADATRNLRALEGEAAPAAMPASALDTAA